jgi:prepilin-type N-terminal cleavage/methylation domain-containing protein
MQLKNGFSLVELAVVLFIVSLLLGGVILTLSAREDQRATTETQRRLEAASDAVIGFALAYKRLPCPAAGATGDESLASGTPATGGPCTNNFGGFLPGRAVGFQTVDAQGFALDAWGNRIRYAVASAVVASTCSAGTPHFTSVNNLKANGVGCRPYDLVICQSSSGTNPGASPPSCGTAQSVTNQETVAFVLHSAGKNGIGGAASGPDEAANTNNDAVFIHREHGTIETATGIYDDVLLWVPAGVLYSKLIAGGILP